VICNVLSEEGTSAFACGLGYAGPEPNSEPETQNIIALFESMDPMPILSVHFHSAANVWLYPYGYATGAFPDNVDEIRELAEDAVEALNAVYGQTFAAISAWELCKLML